MSKIKEQDILKLLRGEASPKKLKALEEWSTSDSSHARELELYQLIYDQSDHLSSYTRVDAKAEWDLFKSSMGQKTDSTISETELLSYFDGIATTTERKKVEDWANSKSDHRKSLNFYDTLLRESSHLNEYKAVDANAEWKAFSKAIQGQAVPPNLTAIGGDVATPITAKESSAAPSASIKAMDVEKNQTTSPYQTPVGSVTSAEGAKEIKKADEVYGVRWH